MGRTKAKPARRPTDAENFTPSPEQSQVDPLPAQEDQPLSQESGVNVTFASRPVQAQKPRNRSKARKAGNKRPRALII